MGSSLDSVGVSCKVGEGLQVLRQLRDLAGYKSQPGPSVGQSAGHLLQRGLLPNSKGCFKLALGIPAPLAKPAQALLGTGCHKHPGMMKGVIQTSTAMSIADGR